MVVWVLRCQDEEIERGVGYSTLKSPMTPLRKRYRPPINTKDRERRGSVLGEEDVVGVRGGEFEIGQGRGFHPRNRISSVMHSILVGSGSNLRRGCEQ
jgi:hypothetical protein